MPKLTIEQLADERVSLPYPDGAYCPHKDCKEYSFYIRCYFHTYISCPTFVDYWNTLDKDKQKELLK